MYSTIPELLAAAADDSPESVWIHTGDPVERNDDGSFTFVGRRKEVIRRRETLSPAEVEACLESHPDVAEVAMIGVPSDMSEDEVKAFVVAGPNRWRAPIGKPLWLETERRGSNHG